MTDSRYFLGKLRLARGANYMLCQQAADEITRVRKKLKATEIELLKKRLELEKLQTQDEIVDHGDDTKGV